MPATDTEIVDAAFEWVRTNYRETLDWLRDH